VAKRALARADVLRDPVTKAVAAAPAEHRDAAARTYASEARANGPRTGVAPSATPGLSRNRSVLGGLASGLGA